MPTTEPSIKVLADTSFFIRLLKEIDPLHANAKSYYKYLLDHSGIILCSTIAIAEYCVKGKLEELPLKTIQVVPFNVTHAEQAGEFARICFDAGVKVSERGIIANDCKMLAQAEVEKTQFFLTSDSRARSLFDTIAKIAGASFRFVDISVPVVDAFGSLALSN
jgi:predicted nucleic acid-binding protein